MIPTRPRLRKPAGVFLADSVAHTKNNRKKKVRWTRTSIPKRRPTGMDQLRIDIPASILSTSPPRQRDSCAQANRKGWDCGRVWRAARKEVFADFVGERRETARWQRSE